MSVRVIVGEDDYLVSEKARELLGDGSGVETIDSANASNADLQLADLQRADESFSTPPFLEPQKATWWKNVHFLPGGKSSEIVKAALERFAAKIARSAATMPDNQHFVLSGPHLLKTSVFAKRLKGVAEFFTFEQGKPWEAQRTAVACVSERAARAGFSFAPGAAERFVATVGVDMRSLASEIAKLRDYLGPEAKIASTDDVSEIASPGAKVEAELWDVTDAVGRRDAEAALVALGKFEREAGFAVFLSGVLERFFRQLLDVKRGRTEGMSPFALRKNAGFAERWSLTELRVARARFLALREKVVSGTVSGDVLVVTELVRALRRRSPSG